MSLGGRLMDGMLQAVSLQFLIDELASSVTVQSELQRMRQVGMIVIDLGQETLDGLRSFSLRAE